MKLRKTLLVILSLVLMVCLSGITVFSATANDEIVFNASEIESSIKTSYSQGQEVEFPSTVTINYKNADYTAGDGILQFPSGISYSISSHVLSETGKYTAKYFFEAEGGVYVTASIEFNVLTTYYNFDVDDGSKVEIHTEPGPSIDDKGNGYQDHNQYLWTTKIGGLKVDVKDGNTFRINKPINLNKINNTNFNSSNIVRVTPTNMHQEDNVLPLFLEKGTDAYSIGNVDPETGDVVQDNTAIVTEIFSGSSSVAPKIKFNNLPEGVKGSDFYVEVYGYNKAKAYIGKMVMDENGTTKVYGDKTWSFTSAKNYMKDKDGVDQYGKINYIRVVIKYEDSHVISEEDRLNLASWAFVYRTATIKSADKFVVRLTDAYDPSVYVETVIQYDSTTGWTRVRTSNQGEMGFRRSDTIDGSSTQKITYVDGKRFVVYTSGKYGNNGLKYADADTYYGRRISYDIEKNRVYCESMKEMNTSSNSALVADLENETIYKGNYFEGFTTGEVYVSFYFENYNSTSSQFILHGVADYNLEEIATWGENIYGEGENSGKIVDWTSKPFVDNEVPYVITDFVPTENGAVYAAVGDTIEIPALKFWDVNMVGETAVNVYRNYNSAKRIKVAVLNNTFVAKYTDTYTIEYKQKDASGNVGIYTIPVICVKNNNGKSISINTEKLLTVNAGASVKLPAYTFNTLNNPDAIKVKISAKSDKETINIDADSRTFIPMYSGNYVLTYEFNDNFGYDSYSYEFEVVANDTSVIYKEVPSLPRYFIKGQKYNIEQPFAYKFNTGAPLKENAEMFAIFDNSGARVKVENPLYTEITGNETVSFIYVLDGIEYASDIVPIIDATYYNNGVAQGYDMYKYFTGDTFYYNDINEETSTREGNIVYYAKEGVDEMKLSFINALDYNNFSFKYQIRDEYAGFNEITFRLTGVKNPEQVLDVKLTREYKTEDNTYTYTIYLDGEFNRSITGVNWSDTRAKNFSYSSSTRDLTIGGTTFKHICNFEGELVYFDIIIGDIFDTTGIFVTNLCNQKLSGTTYKDSTAAIGTIVTTQGEYVIGDEVTLNLPVFSDVLSQINPETLSFTVTDSQGGSIVSKEGVVLDGVHNEGYGVRYSIVLDKLSKYHVRYTAKDYAGNSVTITYIMTVVDVEAPVVKLVGVKQGETVKAKKWGTFDFSFEVSDNVSQEGNIIVCVVMYEVDTEIWRTDLGTSIQLYKAGLYRVEVLAEDEAGNISDSTFFYIEAK